RAGVAVMTSAASMRRTATFTSGGTAPSGHGEPETSRARERVTRCRVEEAQAVRAHPEADRVAAYSVEAGVEPRHEHVGERIGRLISLPGRGAHVSELHAVDAEVHEHLGAELLGELHDARQRRVPGELEVFGPQ